MQIVSQLVISNDIFYFQSIKNSEINLLCLILFSLCVGEKDQSSGVAVNG